MLCSVFSDFAGSQKFLDTHDASSFKSILFGLILPENHSSTASDARRGTNLEEVPLVDGD